MCHFGFSHLFALILHTTILPEIAFAKMRGADAVSPSLKNTLSKEQ
jgi:hypothetical protein